MTEYMTIEIDGGPSQWNPELARRTANRWKVHTAAFPGPGKLIALLEREAASTGLAPEDPVGGASGDLVGLMGGGTVGRCVVCGVTADLDAQRTCGNHLRGGTTNLPPPLVTKPRRG